MTATVRLRWTPASRASSYDVYFGTSNPPPLHTPGVTDTELVIPAIPDGTTYFWSVEALSDCLRLGRRRSPTRTVRTAGTCPAPKPFSTIEPAMGAITSATPTLSWTPSADATSYDVYFGEGTPPPLYTSVSATSVKVSGLTRGRRYTWKITARSACGTSTASTPEHALTVTAVCQAPEQPASLVGPEQELIAGQSYSLSWSRPAKSDDTTTYIIERATDPAFASLLDTQRVDGLSAVLIAPRAGQYHHRVRAVADCGRSVASLPSPSAAVATREGMASVVFTKLPKPLVSALGVRLDDLRNEFILENVGGTTARILIGTILLNDSPPFFSIHDPLEGDATFVTLEPGVPKRLVLRYSGPDGAVAGTYEGLISVAGLGSPLASNPWANVSLRVGGKIEDHVTPRILVDGVQTDVLFMPRWSGDDSGRPSSTIELVNSGSIPLDLAASVGPEAWVRLEKGWNSSAIPASSFRGVRLFTERRRGPSTRSYPRRTYLTVTNYEGESARLLVVDNGNFAVEGGRSTTPEARANSAIIPWTVSEVLDQNRRRYSELQLTNLSHADIQLEVIYTPEDADGFDAAKVSRVQLIIPANEGMLVGDPLRHLFNLPSPQNGSLEVRIAEEQRNSVLIAAALAETRAGGGRHETPLPVFRWGSGARRRSRQVLAAIPALDGARPDLLLAETSGRDHATVTVALLDPAGLITSSRTLDVPRYGQRRLADVLSVVGGNASRAARIEIIVEAGEGSVIGVLATIAPLSAQPSRDLDSHASRTKWMVTGVLNEEPRRTALSITSADIESVTAKIEYRTEDGITHVRSVQLLPGQTFRQDDVLITTFGLTSPSRGTIVVEADGVVAVWAGVRDAARALFTSLQAMPHSRTDSWLTGMGESRPLFADGVEISAAPDRGTRSGLVLREVRGAPAVVTLRLFDPSDRRNPIAEKEFSLSGNEERRLDNLAAEMDLASNDRQTDHTSLLLLAEARGMGGVAATLLSNDVVTGCTFVQPLSGSSGIDWTSLTEPSALSRRRAARR